MKSVFLVVNKGRKTVGHGSTELYTELATYVTDEDNQYPAFKSRESAQKFIDKVSKYWKDEIIELTFYINE